MPSRTPESRSTIVCHINGEVMYYGIQPFSFFLYLGAPFLCCANGSPDISLAVLFKVHGVPLEAVHFHVAWVIQSLHPWCVFLGRATSGVTLEQIDFAWLRLQTVYRNKSPCSPGISKP